MSGEAVTINTELNTTSTSDTPKTERPAHVPEKFWDAEKGAVKVDDVLKSYGELEKKIGQPKTPETPATPPETPATTDAAAEALKAKGVDYAALTAEYQKDGKLSEATMADLASRGITAEMVASHVAGLQAQTDVVKSYALEGIGEDKYGQVVTWAKDNLGPADIEAYNKLVDGAKTKEEMKAAVANLVARYENANGREPNLLGIKGTAPNADVYRDLSQMQADMRDPRYAVSEDFRSTSWRSSAVRASCNGRAAQAAPRRRIRSAVSVQHRPREQ
jgi:hypothetical protein